MLVKMSNELDSTFFLTFSGQKVIITTNMSSNVSAQDDNGNSLTVPIFYEGILLDYDNEWLYLSDNAQEINQAVPRSAVIHIGINEDKDVFEEILDEMGDPSRKEDVN